MRRSDAFTSASLPPTAMSKNAYKKKQEMLKIALDNVSMRNRIVSTPAYYRLKDCQEHMSNHKHLLQMHCEFPLVIEKGEDKPGSAYMTRNSSIQKPQSSNQPNTRDITTGETKERQFKISKNSNLGRLSSTSQSFFKKPESEPEIQPSKPKKVTFKKDSSKDSSNMSDKLSKSAMNNVLMTRHFLQNDVILIFEDVLQYDKQLYHCSLTKPK